MDYIEIDIRISGVSESALELLPYLLEKIGFEGFVNIPDWLLAYIPSATYRPEELAKILREYKFPENCFSAQVIPEKNWNEEWEQNFQPVVIAEKCLIRAQDVIWHRSSCYHFPDG
jgi:ribosomal protein L11 methyltransferase